MEIEALGGFEEVGRSAFLIQSEEGNLILDYGVKLQGMENPVYPKNPYNKVDRIDLALISHAHLDHIGYLPWLFKKHRFPWYSTPPTLDIGKVLWKDSIKLAKMKGLEDHYHYRAMEKAEKNWYPALFNTRFKHGKYKFKFYDAGHILGSASISVEIEGKHIHYSGDVGYRSALQRSYDHPGQCDVLFIETTYATEDHPPISEAVDELMELIYDALDNGGHALLPAFAVGRTQELLMHIYRRDKKLPIYIDGMGRDITRIYLKYGSYMKHFLEFEKAVAHANIIEKPTDRKEALSKPSVIITTAGMMDGGPVLYYVNSLKPNSKIILNGYQADGSNGRRLLETGKLLIDEYEIGIEHEVHKLDFSAHIGKEQILDYIHRASPKEVWLMHSEKEKAEALAEELKDYSVVY